MVHFMPARFCAVTLVLLCSTSTYAASGPFGPANEPAAWSGDPWPDVRWSDEKLYLDLPTGGLHSDEVVDLTLAVQHPAAQRTLAESRTAESESARSVVAKTVAF